jgi:hypothetical protein
MRDPHSFLRIRSTFGLALFWQQTMESSRVFDIRCFLRKTGIIKKTKTPTMGHSFKEWRDGSLGECEDPSEPGLPARLCL